MRTWGLRITVIGCLLATAGGVALAQPTSVEEKKKLARELYDQASVKYDFGQYQAAIELYTKSYETYPSPSSLFNIAQAHRQLGDCKQALHFYTRYLEKKPDAVNRGEVEGFIKQEQDKQAQGRCTGSGAAPAPTPTPAPAPTAQPTAQPTAPTAQPTAAPTTAPTAAQPTAPAPTGPASAPPAGGLAATDTTAADVGASAAFGEQPKLIAARFGMGPSFPSFGGLDPAPAFGFALGAGHPISMRKLLVDVGGMITYAPVPWEGPEGQTGTVGFTGILANAGIGFELPAQLLGRAEVGVGALVMTGATAPGNPFIAEDEMATGALSFMHMRLALGVEYGIGNDLVLIGQPLVLSWSPASKLRDEVTAITRYEMMVGVGYKL